uniref:Uncharacterized protein n=1 Tax=Arundo donax TaxID=35708 RepID=A0A0A9A7H9_ARUDO
MCYLIKNWNKPVCYHRHVVEFQIIYRSI